jgi:putative aldouronate transport system permease protein
MGAYVLSRKRMPGRNAMAILITITMFLNGGMIPTYLLVRSLGFIDKIWAMLLPGAIQTYNLIILMSYFRSIHESMEESAKMDGANDFTILWRIFVPLAKPSIAVITLYYVVSKWNSFVYPLLFLTKRELLPLQIVLRQILIASEISSEAIQTAGGEGYQAYAEAIRYGTIIVAILPILMIYPFIQKYFVKGTMIGAIKE